MRILKLVSYSFLLIAISFDAMGQITVDMLPTYTKGSELFANSTLISEELKNEKFEFLNDCSKAFFITSIGASVETSGLDALSFMAISGTFREAKHLSSKRIKISSFEKLIHSSYGNENAIKTYSVAKAEECMAKYNEAQSKVIELLENGDVE